MYRVDLNADLGESFGAYTIGMDSEVIRYISSANVACGFHAGDPLVMEQTVKMAKEAGTAVGAHPGFPDLSGFGRRNMKVSVAEAKAYIKYQIGALKAFTDAAGILLQHVKPHGAFYNMAAVDDSLSEAICEGILETDPKLVLLGLAGSAHLRAARKLGLPCASEVFADRAYMDDGTLVPRSRPDSMITDADEAIARTVRMIREGTVVSVNGNVIPIEADSVCVHGDNPHAVEFVRRMREAFAAEGIEVMNIAAVIAK